MKNSLTERGELNIIPDFQSWMVKNGVKPQIKTCDLTSFLFVIP